MDKNSDVTVNTNKGPSNKWLSCFLKRHPEISMRTPDSIHRGRYGMANTTVINDCWKNVLIIWVIPVFICNKNYKESKFIKKILLFQSINNMEQNAHNTNKLASYLTLINK